MRVSCVRTSVAVRERVRARPMSRAAVDQVEAPVTASLDELKALRDREEPVRALTLCDAPDFRLTHQTASVLLGFPALQVLRLPLSGAAGAHEDELQECLERLAWCVSSPWRELELSRWRDAPRELRPECLFQLPRLCQLRLVDVAEHQLPHLRVPKGWRAKRSTPAGSASVTLECTRDAFAGAPGFVLVR